MLTAVICGQGSRARRASAASAASVAMALVLANLPPQAEAVPAQLGEPQVPAVLLPGDARATSVTRDLGTWIVAGKRGRKTWRIARRFGAVPVFPDGGIFEVGVAQADRLARALKRHGLLVFAEPNFVTERRSAFPQDPLSQHQWWLPPVVDPALSPPVVDSDSPLLAVVDEQIDVSHPELSSGSVTNLRQGPVLGSHGTQVTAVAGASANGQGITGIWPGMRILGVESRSDGCTDTARAVVDAVRAGASVINMSYGFSRYCRTHHVATNLAFGAGVTLVAAAGNEHQRGNRPIHPGADPHIITVAALAPDLSAAPFSTANAAVDVSAPGVDVLTATPMSLDADGERDGYTASSGTSLSAPIVAGTAAWVRAERPRLHHTQLTDLLRYSARDLGPRGWDRDYGFGLSQVERALRHRAPSRDPLEPNEDVAWIDGRWFGRADPPIWRGGRGRRLRARLDDYEDPVDVYRAIVPGRTRVLVRMRPIGGDADLEVYNGRSTTVYGRRGRIMGSYRAGRRLDRVGVINRGRRRRKAYIVVYVSRRSRGIDPRYTLSIRRLR